MKHRIVMLSVVVVLSLVSLVSAGVGVASEYYQLRPMEVYPGQEAETYFLVQNTIGDEGGDAIVVATIREGEEVISFAEDPIYVVPFGQQKIAKVVVKVPEDARVGESYDVEVLFSPQAGDEGGGAVQFLTKVKRVFSVQVVEEPADSISPQSGEARLDLGSVWIWVIIIVILAAAGLIVWYFIKKRKGSSPGVEVQQSQPQQPQPQPPAMA